MAMQNNTLVSISEATSNTSLHPISLLKAYGMSVALLCNLPKSRNWKLIGGPLVFAWLGWIKQLLDNKGYGELLLDENAMQVLENQLQSL
jgi:hypothetical protein